MRLSQATLNSHRERMRAAEYAPRDPTRVHERRHGLAEIVGRGAIGFVERLGVILPHLEREVVVITENASRRGQRFEKQGLGFFEALEK